MGKHPLMCKALILAEIAVNKIKALNVCTNVFGSMKAEFEKVLHWAMLEVQTHRRASSQIGMVSNTDMIHYPATCLATCCCDRQASSDFSSSLMITWKEMFASLAVY